MRVWLHRMVWLPMSGDYLNLGPRSLLPHHDRLSPCGKRTYQYLPFSTQYSPRPIFQHPISTATELLTGVLIEGHFGVFLGFLGCP
ncbi:MAG: hypothetical protein H6Q04_2782 [Acidobacteria bacterium]|jgi:hypothetical protein|nr:hypothetical protein [Acidobacteriota bacterium]